MKREKRRERSGKGRLFSSNKLKNMRNRRTDFNTQLKSAVNYKENYNLGGEREKEREE
jgi:hypothetical protein